MKYKLKNTEHECWQFEGFEKVEEHVSGHECPPWVAALILTGKLIRHNDHYHLLSFSADGTLDESYKIDPGDWLIDLGFDIVACSKAQFFEVYEPLAPEKSSI